MRRRRALIAAGRGGHVVGAEALGGRGARRDGAMTGAPRPPFAFDAS
jgi:hypothetical protein